MNTKWFDESGNLDMKKLIKLTPEESVEATREIKDVIKKQNKKENEEIKQMALAYQKNANLILDTINEVLNENNDTRKTKKL